MPAEAALSFDLARPEDVGLYAEIWSRSQPDDAADPALLRSWWEQCALDAVRAERYFVREAPARLLGICSWSHPDWSRVERRFGRLDVRLLRWEPSAFRPAMEFLEARLREEGAEMLAAKAREGAEAELAALAELGYRPDRLARWWELDLARSRGPLLALAARTRERTREQGAELLTLDRAGPEALRQMHEVSLAGEADVPTTIPVAASSFEAFLADLRSPGSPPDRVWLARDRGSGAVLGMSWLVYPATAGDVWTAWTTVARAARGRGLGLALKVETVLQAMELGVRRVRTENDEANLPILRLNEAMGYRPIAGQVQLLKPA